MPNPALTRKDIVTVLEPRFSQPELAQAWYETQSVPGFGTSTAEQLVDAGRGQEVLDLIAAVDAGIYA